MVPQLDFEDRLRSFGSTMYTDLRGPQARVLAGYIDKISLSDLAVELPTGYGKTLVALLIADLALERGSRVAYLTGNNQLADQVIVQAATLPGLDIAKFSSKHYPPAELASYHDARAVGVMNYWTYFNSSPKVEPGDLVIFDDAHLAEQPLAGMFGVRIERSRDRLLYERVCDLILAHTDLYPSIELMRDGSAGPTTPPELLSFYHWSAVAAAVAETLTDGLPRELAMHVWPSLRPNLPACGLLVGPTAIELRPYHPPTQTLNGYRHAKQRLYLSATLGTMDDLQRRLGVLPVTSIIEDPVAADEVGQRTFILSPSDCDPLEDEPFEFALRQAARAGRTTWLCASHAEADRLELLLSARAIVSYRLRGGGDDGALDRWSQDARGHLVTAGRYDGLDLAGDLCRLVVLPSVPAASTEFERFVMAYLGDAAFMRHRVGQRVTQALGRANRRDGDWAMYIGLAPGFGTLLAQSGVQAAIPADVRPTIDDALVRLSGGWPAARQAAEEFWTFRGAAKLEVTTVPTTRVRPGRSRPASTAGSAADEVSAVTRMWLGDLDQASASAAQAATKLSAAREIEHAAFWRYVEAQARYTQRTPSSVGEAIDALKEATEGGAATTWFIRLRRVLSDVRGEQAVRTDELPWTVWDEWIQQSGTAAVRRAIERSRAGISGTHNQQAEAIELLGRMAGAVSSRPAGQAVTDVVWSWPAGRRIERRLWEVKTGSPDRVPREWIDQALGQLAEAGAAPRRNTSACVVTHLSEIEDDARRAAVNSVAIIHVDFVMALIDLLGARLAEYGDRSGTGTAAERGAARELIEPRIPRGNWLAKLLAPTEARVLLRDDVEAFFERP